jgi:hypothetical protein
MDLLGRKVLGDMGAKLMKFGREIEQLVAMHAANPAMQEFTSPLAALWGEVQTVTAEIGQKALANPDDAGAAAVPYLRLIGHLVFSFAWCFAVGVALRKLPADGSEGAPFYTAKLATARFYFARLYPETAALLRQVRAGSAPLMALSPEMF